MIEFDTMQQVKEYNKCDFERNENDVVVAGDNVDDVGWFATVSFVKIKFACTYNTYAHHNIINWKKYWFPTRT